MTTESRCPFIVATPVKMPRGNIHTTRFISKALLGGTKTSKAYDEYVQGLSWNLEWPQLLYKDEEVWKLDGLEEPISRAAFNQRWSKLKKLCAIPTRSFCGQPARYMINGSSLCWEHADHLSRRIVSDDILWSEFRLALEDNVGPKKRLAIERSRTNRNRNWLLGEKSHETTQ